MTTTTKPKDKTDERGQPLDLYSTSPTDFPTTLLQERRSDTSPCIYNAPYFGYEAQPKVWKIKQGNCHHWDCPRCGLGRAKQEYRRMVSGCGILAESMPLYFITITCKGREETWQNAEEKYGQRTNRVLDACRAKWKRDGGQWHYVQVTERQKRRHPHSHFITSFCPPVSSRYVVRKKKRSESGQPINGYNLSTHLRSDWFEGQITRSGLGARYDISIVNSAEGASRYVAKYLFKSTIFDSDWPKGWKRIRYSQGFPQPPEIETNAIVLIKHEDWYRLAKHAVIVLVDNLDDFQTATNHLWYHDTIIRLK